MLSVQTEKSWRVRGTIGLLVFCFVVKYSSAGDAVSLNNDNINSILTRNDVVFVNFYADWCRFSQMLAPTFDEASRKLSEEITQPGKALFAKVDCDKEVEIASQYRISKYPTLKLFRNGQIVKKEYRGQRSADSLAGFIREELKDPVIEHHTLDELDEIDTKKRNIIGYFEVKDSENYKTFARMASFLRDDCSFHAAFGDVSASERIGGDSVSFRPKNAQRQDQVYMVGPLNNFDQLFSWAYEKCVPLVREITFENAEELTEEGLPFLILFHNPDDTATVETYNQEVGKQLLSEKTNVNFLVADGTKFTHPLHHLGKSLNDLPVLAIDSFRHMYVFPHNVKTDLGKPGLLKQFVEDLHSGKLHREFHHGPDPVTPTPTPPAPPVVPLVMTRGERADIQQQAERPQEMTIQQLAEKPQEMNIQQLAEKPQEMNIQQQARIWPPKMNFQQQGVRPRKEQAGTGQKEHLPKEQGQPSDQPPPLKAQKQTQPPESTFKKLAPSRSRYTILRDEL